MNIKTVGSEVPMGAPPTAVRPTDPLTVTGANETQVASGDGGTRSAIINLLLAEGPVTAPALAEKLQLSAAGIRRHLDVLVDEKAVTSREQIVPGRRGRGRPARVYLLTDLGRERLPHGYDSLALQALRYLGDVVGPGAITRFAKDRAQKMVAPKRQAIIDAPDSVTKVSLLAEALSDSGFAASHQQLGKGEQLCQHHCPVAHVAAEFPQLCEEEMAVFTEVLGTYAQRLATIARGDSFCTTFIPHTPAVVSTPT